MSKGLLLVVSGPSGVGKGTVLASLRNREDIYYSVSVTTRAPREGETDGKDYYFVDRAAFDKLVAEQGVLEYANYVGNFYGTPRKAVEEKLAQGKHVILEIDSCGALQVMKNCPEAVTIFIMPPSMEELRERLTGRGTEPPEVIEQRLAKAEYEISKAQYYRYIIVNNTVESTLAQIVDIIKENQ